MTTEKKNLSLINPHSRDSLITFHSYGHRYEITNDKNSTYTSVTTWVHTHFPKFDADEVIYNIFHGRNWGPNNKYWGMSVEQIKLSWKNLGQASCHSGTNLHEQIELFYNNINKNEIINPLKNTKEWEYFMNFVNNNSHLKPYRTEWMIFDEDLKIAGSIDMVFENDDGTLTIYDWKRCKEINRENNWNKYASNCIISHISDTNYWHYSLQLNTYKAILERKYDKIVKELFLVRLFPEAENYELIEVPILTEEINNLFEERIHLNYINLINSISI